MAKNQPKELGPALLDGGLSESDKPSAVFGMGDIFSGAGYAFKESNETTYKENMGGNFVVDIVNDKDGDKSDGDRPLDLTPDEVDNYNEAYSKKSRDTKTRDSALEYKSAPKAKISNRRGRGKRAMRT